MKKILTLCAALSLAAFARPASAELIYAIAQQGAQQNLISFDSSDPSNLLSASFVGSLAANETILGIDFRPADKKLYATTTGGGGGVSNRLITIDTVFGSAANVGPLGTPLSGVHFGFDFNPTIDRARSVSETNQNVVIDPNTGTVTLIATPVAYAVGDIWFGTDPNVVDLAYDNNFVGALTSQLYGIDTGTDFLVKQANNTGVLTTVGPLSGDFIAVGGFDISGVTGKAYAVLQPANSSQASLYSINLVNGVATSLGVVDGGLTITAMSVAPVPEPATLGLALSAVLGLVALRRRAA